MTVVSPTHDQSVADQMLAARRCRNALFILFSCTGLAVASWVTRTPAVRDQLSVSLSQMGMLMVGISSGAICGLLSANFLIARMSTRWVAGGGVGLLAIGMGVVGLGTWSQSLSVTTIGLFMMGFGMGAPEIAINIEGAAAERTLATPVLPMLHGFFSAGTLFGGVIGIGLAAINFPPAAHFILTAIIMLLAIIKAIPALPLNYGERHTTTDTSEHGSQAAQVWKDPRLWLIGIVCLAMAMAEGSANDWLPLLMVDGHGVDAAMSSLIFTGFAAGMTLGRFVGNGIVARSGRGKVIFFSALSCAFGIGLAVFSDSSLWAGLSVIFWGLGASLGFPLTISAAGDSGAHADKRVSFVALVGYLAFLAGPPLLGFVGENHGLRDALMIVLALLIIAAVLSPATRKLSSSSS
ncbi:MFS transporter [Carnimonas bestiolae]|uniref:MFS transporter n=1 Tax=Carnimonas bestiolae TaxID=3402172 RepID=UPI003EDBF0BF